jgi:apolipoprotein N-acyltransferase
MAFANSYRKLAEAALAVAATGTMFYLGNGLEPLWPLMWFAPLPVLLFALGSPWWGAGLTAVTAIILGSLNMWSYLTQTLGIPAAAWFGIFAVAGVFFSLGVLLFRALVLRGAVWSGLIALPAVYVTSEYLRNLTTPHGTAGSLAYSQLRFLPFLQLASITGPWGMTFVLLLFPSAIAIALYWRKSSSRRVLEIAAAGVGTVALVLAFGWMRLAEPQSRPQMVKVGLIASDEKGNLLVTDPGADTDRLFRDYAQQADRLASEGAQAIVMPEKVGVTLEGKSATTDGVLQSLADQTGATIVAGVVDVDGPAKYNQARIYTPSAHVQRYDKEHMLPPFESNLTTGKTLVLLSRPQQKWGVAICKDMDFESPAHRYGGDHAGLMMVPAWDFVVDASWHGHIAIMRGVEDGFSIARAAKNGFLTVSDDRGRILGEVRSSAAPFATLLVSVPAVHDATVYQALGDWFAWVAIALLLGVIFQLVRLRRQIPAYHA